MKEFSEFFGNFNDFLLGRPNWFSELQSIKTQYILRKISAPHLEGFNKKFDFLKVTLENVGLVNQEWMSYKSSNKGEPFERNWQKKLGGGGGGYLIWNRWGPYWMQQIRIVKNR